MTIERNNWCSCQDVSWELCCVWQLKDVYTIFTLLYQKWSSLLIQACQFRRDTSWHIQTPNVTFGVAGRHVKAPLMHWAAKANATGTKALLTIGFQCDTNSDFPGESPSVWPSTALTPMSSLCGPHFSSSGLSCTFCVWKYCEGPDNWWTRHENGLLVTVI